MNCPGHRCHLTDAFFRDGRGRQPIPGVYYCRECVETNCVTNEGQRCNGLHSVEAFIVVSIADRKRDTGLRGVMRSFA